MIKKFIKLCALTTAMVLTFSVTAFASPEDDKAKLEAQKQEIVVQINESQSNMEKAHQIAETARSMGVAEDNPIITEAKQLWTHNYTQKSTLEAKIAELDAEIIRLSKYSYVGVFKLTGYCNCAKCCGHSSGKTASGTYPVEGRTVAASKQFPFGTRLYIEGLGEYVVEDRGGFASNVIDMYSSTHSGCYRAEYNQSAKVYVIND